MPPDNHTTTGAEHPDTGSVPPTERPLNPRLRPQRLFQKVQVAMEIVLEKIKDKKQTTLSEWLSKDELEQLRLAVRSIIRKQYDATFDTWPARAQHNYLPDVREAIVQALNKGISEKWEMFDIPTMNHDDSENNDEFVAGDFLKSAFWAD